MMKHTQTIRRQQPTDCLRVFDRFVGLGLKELRRNEYFSINRKVVIPCLDNYTLFR